jgi:pSer/pThr/pTyr-binding forkhead associated (FHA) protein
MSEPRYVLLCDRPPIGYPLMPGEHTLGRAADASLLLDNPAVSRRHCRIVVDADGECAVRDTQSRAGTMVNGTRITEPVRLKVADVIGICDYRLRLSTGEEQAGPSGPREGSLEWAEEMGYLDTAYEPEEPTLDEPPGSRE